MEGQTIQSKISSEQVKETPSALRARSQASSLKIKDKIDEMFEFVFIKEKTGEVFFHSKNFIQIWSIFVNLGNSFENEVYIVEKCLKKVAEEPHLRKAVVFRVCEYLVYDYKRCPTWRPYFKEYYADFVDFGGIERDLFSLSEQKQERVFDALKNYEVSSDEEEPELIPVPGFRNQKEKLEDWD